MQQIIVYVEISLIAKETTMENNQNAIEVRNMSKDFKLVFDKPTTLKERLIFWNREKPQWHHVL